MDINKSRGASAIVALTSPSFLRQGTGVERLNNRNFILLCGIFWDCETVGQVISSPYG